MSVEIYTKSTCGYCHAAKALLDKKNLAYAETDIARNPEARKVMIDRAGGRMTVPQIFINGRHIGGFDDLYKLDRAGKLDPLLAS